MKCVWMNGNLISKILINLFRMKSNLSHIQIEIRNESKDKTDMNGMFRYHAK